ncbi:MAG: hypothetical protein LBN11_04740 [Tannerella sp.]|jgi:hypothetical protein|nr:hypothetical protein [Tannerella sp.]
MQINIFMCYKEVIEKRLNRKKQELEKIESSIESGGLATAIEKRKFIELKAIVNELENCIDIAESMSKLE